MARGKRLEKIHRAMLPDLPFNAEVATTIEHDPYSPIGERMLVTRSIRNDPLAAMLSRRQIDRAQFEAGRRWQANHERAEVGSVIAMDPLKEPVDGSAPTRAVFTDHQLIAFQELREAERALGRQGSRMVCAILGEGLTITDFVVRHGGNSQREIDYAWRRLRECLETLAVLWGFAARPVESVRKSGRS